MDTIPFLQNVILDPQICAKIDPQGIRIDPLVSISNNVLFHPPVHFFGQVHVSRVKIDAYSYIMARTIANSVDIGRYCSIGHNIEIGTPQQDFTCLSTSSCFTGHSDFQERTGLIKRIDPLARKYGDEYPRTTIGHDVWVGADVCIASGVTIGSGAVLGAGSVITHDIPPYAIVGGRDNGKSDNNIIKGYRFSDEVISDLLEINWWNYDLAKLMASSQDSALRVPFNDVKAFISFFRNSDTTYWPRIADSWYYLVTLSANQVELRPVAGATAARFDMGKSYSKEQCRDPSWY